MKNYISKYQGEVLEYNGFIIDFNQADKSYRIVERLIPDKFKVRRVVVGTFAYKKNKHGQRIHHKDLNGSQLYNPFTSKDEAISHAKNFIDKHIVPWEQKSKMLK